MLISFRQSVRLIALMLVGLLSAAFGPYAHGSSGHVHDMDSDMSLSVQTDDGHDHHHAMVDDQQDSDRKGAEPDCCSDMGICAAAAVYVSDVAQLISPKQTADHAQAPVNVLRQSDLALDSPPPKLV